MDHRTHACPSRAADWCLRNDLPEEALECSIAAGDVDTAAASALGASALVAAELRLLPLLSTHLLSFPEIAGELFVPRYTVKSEVNSIYRKLGASSRSEAVAQAGDLGLLGREGARVVPFHPDGVMPRRGGVGIVRSVGRDWSKVPAVPAT